HLRPDDQALAEALWLVIVGLTALWAGYFFFGSALTVGVPRLRLSTPKVLTRVEFAGWLGAAMGISYSLAQQSGFEQPVAKELCGLLGSLGRIILLWLLLTGQLGRITKIVILIALIGYEAVKGITSGLLAEFLRPMLEILLVYVHVKRR